MFCFLCRIFNHAVFMYLLFSRVIFVLALNSLFFCRCLFFLYHYLMLAVLACARLTRGCSIFRSLLLFFCNLEVLTVFDGSLWPVSKFPMCFLVVHTTQNEEIKYTIHSSKFRVVVLYMNFRLAPPVSMIDAH